MRYHEETRDEGMSEVKVCSFSLDFGCLVAGSGSERSGVASLSGNVLRALLSDGNPCAGDVLRGEEVLEKLPVEDAWEGLR